MLQFDDETAAIFEAAYRGADFRRRRETVLQVLAPRPGERIADVGCGNGMLTEALALSVGPGGRILAVDPSPDMRGLAEARCEGLSHVAFREGSAQNTGLGDAGLDAAVSLQVFEYISDLAPAAAEMHRILRPGGRLAIGDLHWGTLAWFSDDPARMSRMIASWDTHLAERCIPTVLPPVLRASGFEVEAVVPFTTTDIDFRPDGLARTMSLLAERHAVARGDFLAEEARAWAEEQAELARAGRFFFSITHFSILARKA